MTLVINLMEHCEENRDLILKAFLPQKTEDMFTVQSDSKKTAAEGLVEMFLEKEENARREESKTGKKIVKPKNFVKSIWSMSENNDFTEKP